MQKPFGDIRNAEIRLPEIRTYLYETVGKVIESSGYKFRKSDFTFKKKWNKDYIQFMFLFHDYNPVNYDTQFSFIVFNNAIEEIKTKITFNEFLGSTDWASLIIPMGDFIESEKGKDVKWRHYYNFYLSTRKELMDATEKMSGLLKDEILPLCEELFTIDGINNLFAARGGKWTASSLNINNITADLISARLTGKRDYHDVYNSLMTEIKVYTSKEWLHSSAIPAMEELYDYLQKY